VHERERQLEAAELERDALVPEMRPAVAPRRVRERERDERGGEQQDAARGLDREEAAQRPRDPLREAQRPSSNGVPEKSGFR
jgi:hypothetical protein